MLSHSCLIQASVAQRLRSLSHLPLYDAPNVFYGWTIWTAGWPFQYPDPSSTQPWCCNWCSMWSGIVMLENARSSLKETRLDGSICCSRTWIYLSALMVPFQMCKWAHVVISITVAFLYVMQCRLRARRSRASSMVFRPWPLRTEIVPDSLNLWMILCTVDDDNFKLFAIFLWETPFWYCSTIFPSWLLRDTATLRGSFYTQSCCQLT